MRTNSGLWRLLIVVLASTILLPGSAGAAEIRVMLSGGFGAAYLALVPEFERTTGHTVSTVRGGSTGTTPNSIPSRLQRGESVDVVVMNANALDGLVKEGRIAAGTHVDLGRTHLALAVRAGSPKPDIGSVDTFKRAMRSAKSIQQPAVIMKRSLSSTNFMLPRRCPSVRWRPAHRLGAPTTRSPTRRIQDHSAGALPVQRASCPSALGTPSPVLG